ncbi:hypothetical protein SAMN05421543_109127 [Alicyclobacillus macrosporangiidus]|uniref:Uncharacterized protein n=1 Tax=Alicyclobacillus macrosporangiidus TaxID=392015 RepID=A0A1I7JDH9_9BACL|nr:hypothetical protein SAMN05421543_109127 [Alicyclobacillus macrosporangiidus]
MPGRRHKSFTILFRKHIYLVHANCYVSVVEYMIKLVIYWPFDPY